MAITNVRSSEWITSFAAGNACCPVCLCCACTQAAAGNSTERWL